jgi:hypothetical protein
MTTFTYSAGSVTHAHVCRWCDRPTTFDGETCAHYWTCAQCGADDMRDVCERCDEYADDLASARPSDRNAPEWCGACRGAMFTADDVAQALARDGVESTWVDGAHHGYALVITSDDVAVTVCESETMEAHEYGERCAVMGVTLWDALGPFDAVAWDPSARVSGVAVWCESVADVVAAVHRARFHVGRAS